MWGNEGETPRAKMGLPPEGKTWDEIKDYSPDCNPSHTPIYYNDEKSIFTYVLGVKELGVIVLRSSCDAEGNWSFNGMSIFTKDEIGYTEQI